MWRKLKKKQKNSGILVRKFDIWTVNGTYVPKTEGLDGKGENSLIALQYLEHLK